SADLNAQMDSLDKKYVDLKDNIDTTKAELGKTDVDSLKIGSKEHDDYRIKESALQDKEKEMEDLVKQRGRAKFLRESLNISENNKQKGINEDALTVSYNAYENVQGTELGSDILKDRSKGI